MSDELKQIRDAFRTEASEILTELESSLLELEKDADNMEAVSAIFRAFHTLKGSGGMCGFDDISGFTHQIETVYDLVRNWKIEADKQLIDLTFAASDQIRDMLAAEESGSKVLERRTSDILASFGRLVPDTGKAPKLLKQAGLAEEVLGAAPDTGRQATYRIRFRPEEDIFAEGTNPLLLLRELREMGVCKIIAHTETIPELAELESERCYVYWDIILTTAKSINEIQDVFIFIQDKAEVRTDLIDDGETVPDAEAYKKLGEILVEKKDITKEQLEQVLQERKLLGQVLMEEGLVPQESIEAAITEQEQVKKVREHRQKIEAMQNIRVASRKLDKLVNLVGELVTVQARLSQTALRRDDPELLLIAEEVERLIEELRDTTMNIRMLPIGTTFGKFKRLVRDLAVELGKEVELITEGAETELDKTVIEKLNDPLVHIIRNSIDHGIELPDVRRGKGKSRKGSIRLSATHSGPSMVIRIQDDGAGLDRNAIYARAAAKGLIAPDVELTEQQIYSLILAPGFSTSENVSSVSGRGVGMDVVKKAVDNLRGMLEIDSIPGEGTSITLNLPLTLAIIEGLLVKIADEFFVIPLMNVEECIELNDEGRQQSCGRHVARVRESIIPYIRLRDQFLIAGKAPLIEQIVIVKSDDQRIGFVVDQVIGEHQTVIKNLGQVYKDAEGISGATILGDGTVALILDIPKLVIRAEAEEKASVHTCLQFDHSVNTRGSR